VRPLAQFGSAGTGHIPGAKSFPVEQLLGADEKLLAGSEISDRVGRAGIDLFRPLAAYCGGGIASTLFVLALAEIEKEVSLYPGSWSEWIVDGQRPIER
jgi:thiosulfate/3-mercaptopyruvate sulfurtransferase